MYVQWGLVPINQNGHGPHIGAMTAARPPTRRTGQEVNSLSISLQDAQPH